MLQDYKLGLRMLRKYPGLTVAGGLALAIAIAIGTGWYDLAGKLLFPTIPLPDGDRLVSIETHDTRANQEEPRVARDFLEWRDSLRSVEDLGAYRMAMRNLTAGNAPRVPIQTAELTAAAFRAARVPPLLGRALLDADERPGAPPVVILGYDVWQGALGGRSDVVGSIVQLGSTAATVIGVMPAGFAYPFNHRAWTALQLSASYGALEGGPILVIGRLAPGVTQDQANAELQVLGERAAATLPATHAHLRSRVVPLGGLGTTNLAQLAMLHVPSFLVLLLACTTVGTLIYARTAIREGEIALRSALGASRGRIIGQLFAETLVFTSAAAAVGLVAADRTLRWGIAAASADDGGPPFWMTPGLEFSTVLYAGGLAAVSAAMLSLLPALRATRGRVHPHLTTLGSGGATLRFGRVWTAAMITQVALTAIAIPAALEGASQAIRIVGLRAQFASRDYLAARIELDRSSGERTYAELERRLAQLPGVVAVTFADRAPGGLPRRRTAKVDMSSAPGPAFDYGLATSAVGPGFFDVFDRPIVAGRSFHSGDFSASARTVIVNEAFVRGFRQRGGTGSPVGVRLRNADRSNATAAAPAFEIVGVVRDFGLDPDEEGDESPFVFHPAPAGTMAPLVMNVRVRGNPGALAARLPAIAADVDAELQVREARPLSEWIRQRDLNLIVPVGASAGITLLVLFLSGMGIFSLMSVTVSRRTREIGLRAALGASPRHLLAGILGRAMMLVGSGAGAGGVLLLLFVALGAGPSGRPRDDVMTFLGWLGVTSIVMLSAGVVACLQPARRALRINPSQALKDA